MKKKELEELNKKYQLLLLFNNQITVICMRHTGSYKMIDIKDLKQIQLADLFLKFNIHAFTSYFDKYYISKYKPDLKKNVKFLDGWNKHMAEFLNPLYLEELKKLKEELSDGEKAKDYIS